VEDMWPMAYDLRVSAAHATQRQYNSNSPVRLLLLLLLLLL